MKLLEKIGKVFADANRPRHRVFEVTVRCNRCGEMIHGQIDLYNDLSLEDDGDRVFYFCRKGLAGKGDNRCFETVVVEYTFDMNRRVIEQRVRGGTIVEKGSDG